MLIYIVDDKDHALKQIRYCFPTDHLPETEFRHFTSITQLPSRDTMPPFAVFVDFFLDIDRTSGVDAIPMLNSQFFFGFSSMKPGSDSLAEAALASGKWPADRIFSIVKIKSSLENPELRELLDHIIMRV